MPATRRRLALAALAVAGVVAGVLLVRSRGETPLAPEDALTPPPPPAVRPEDSDLRPGRPSPERTSSRRGANGAPVPKSADEATVTRTVRVRLADGRPAREGVVVWCDPTSAGSHPVAADGALATATIGADGVATLVLDAGDEARAGTLLVAVPGEPNAVPVAYGSLAAESIDVALPRGVAFTGTVVDGDGRPVPDLAFFVTSKVTDDYAIFDEDLDLALVAEGPIPPDFVHVRGRTDASGRFAVRVPTKPGADFAIVRVRSLDAGWFVTTVGTFLAGIGPAGSIDAAVRAAPGVVLDLRVRRRDAAAAGDGAFDAYLRLARTLEFGTYAFGAAMRHATNHVRLGRNGPRDRAYEATIVVSAAGASPALARVMIPAGLDETRVDLVLDRADDAEHTGLVEMTVEGGGGVAGQATPWSLEIATSEPPILRVDVLDATKWAAANRIDARLPPGRWRLRLLHVHEGTRGSAAYEAVAEVAARVTTRVVMAPPAAAAPPK